MIFEIKKQKLEIDPEIIRRVDSICSFCATKAEYENGSIRRISNTNLIYVEPHKIFIKKFIFLAFNDSKYIFLGNLTNKYEYKDLEKILESYRHRKSIGK